MSPQFQTVAALVIVALAAIGLLLRSLVKKKNPGCGGACACSSGEPKARLKR
jgi:hypothetical protein